MQALSDHQDQRVHAAITACPFTSTPLVAAPIHSKHSTPLGPKLVPFPSSRSSNGENPILRPAETINDEKAWPSRKRIISTPVLSSLSQTGAWTQTPQTSEKGSGDGERRRATSSFGNILGSLCMFRTEMTRERTMGANMSQSPTLFPVSPSSGKEDVWKDGMRTGFLSFSGGV